MKHLVELWAAAYSDHATLRTGIVFLHVAGLLVGGGAAIVADRQALAARPFDSFRETHRLVLMGLGLVLVSGTLMMLADVDTYLVSRVFWVKMALICLLLVNGGLIVRTEARVRQDEAAARRSLRRFAGVSLALWFLITLAGAALPNV